MAAPIRLGAIAEREQARVITIKEPGYGSALMGGIAAASGRFVIIGDGDDSYDFLEIPNIVEKLREGFDLVQGCRLPVGETAPFDLARCHFYIAGLAIHFFRFSSGNGFMPRSTTFTVACAVLPRPCTNGSISVAPEWSSPRR